MEEYKKPFGPEFSHQVNVKSISGYANELNLLLDTLSLDSKPAGTLTDTPRSFSTLLAQSCKFLPLRLIALSLYGDDFNDEARIIKLSQARRTSLYKKTNSFQVYSRLMAPNELHSKMMFAAAMGIAT